MPKRPARSTLSPTSLSPTTTVRAAVFDLGGVLVDWNPRYLYRKLLADDAAVETFLAEVCTQEWNARQDVGRPWSEAVESLARAHGLAQDASSVLSRRACCSLYPPYSSNRPCPGACHIALARGIIAAANYQRRHCCEHVHDTCDSKKANRVCPASSTISTYPCCPR